MCGGMDCCLLTVLGMLGVASCSFRAVLSASTGDTHRAEPSGEFVNMTHLASTSHGINEQSEDH